MIGPTKLILVSILARTDPPTKQERNRQRDDYHPSCSGNYSGD